MGVPHASAGGGVLKVIYGGSRVNSVRERGHALELALNCCDASAIADRVACVELTVQTCRECWSPMTAAVATASATITMIIFFLMVQSQCFQVSCKGQIRIRGCHLSVSLDCFDFFFLPSLHSVSNLLHSGQKRIILYFGESLYMTHPPDT